MKSLITVVLLFNSMSFILSQSSESLNVHELVLKNGMTVWLNEDHNQPTVFGAVVVKAGAKDSPNTGIAHYFEHMMFKGTDKIGTIDYNAEKVYLDSIASKYDELAKEEDSKKRVSIQEEINELSVKAAVYVIPNEFNRLITNYGGSRLNAGTSYDYTVYLNTFSSQYIVQWAEINSERLLNPVFRLFQSELETVYEEKNMYRDAMGRDAMEKVMERIFYPHPYAYSIIGSTENLKNPRLSEMRKFFEEYYVASNMGLILSGDFDAKTILPVLESTFGRIRSGVAPQKQSIQIPPFNGEETFSVKFPIPVVKACGFVFRGVPANHPDQVALNIVVGLLNNSNGTGYLDKLMVDRKLMAAMTLNENLNEAGVFGVLVVPKLIFQTKSKARQLVWEQINRIKQGDFTDETFRSLKLEQKKKYVSKLEDINSRAEVMVTLFSQGKSWNDYLKEADLIDTLSKEDIVRVANKYLSDDFLYVTKKTGKYPNDNLPKPNFKPIFPKNADATSAYARHLESMPVKDVEPRFLDFNSDVQIIELSKYAKLYKAANPVNDIFSLEISYGKGKIEDPRLTHLVSYLQLLGTETMTFEQFRGKLQSLGSTLLFDADEHRFVVNITGFDSNFNETIETISLFLQQAKPDDKKIKQLVDSEKILEKAFWKSTDNIAEALLDKVRIGDKSPYLNKLSLSEVKKLKGSELIQLFKDIQKVECDFYYCGNLPTEEVCNTLKNKFTIDQVTVASNTPIYLPMLDYGKAKIYFYNMPDASQSIIYGFQKGSPVTTNASIHASKLFSGYFGGDMSSLMFQEIREFRSFAYRTNGKYILPPFIHKDKPGEFRTMLSTQSDKTVDAITVLHSLIYDMPVKSERLSDVKQVIINQVNGEYPTFRKIPEKIAGFLNEGYSSDPNKALVQDIKKMNIEDIVEFHKNNIANKPIIYVIVGNSKKIDMQKLSSFGEIVHIKKKDIYR